MTFEIGSLPGGLEHMQWYQEDMKEKEKNNIQGKDLIDLIEHKFKQLEEKLHDTLNDRVKKVTS